MENFWGTALIWMPFTLFWFNIWRKNRFFKKRIQINFYSLFKYFSHCQNIMAETLEGERSHETYFKWFMVQFCICLCWGRIHWVGNTRLLQNCYVAPLSLGFWLSLKYSRKTLVDLKAALSLQETAANVYFMPWIWHIDLIFYIVVIGFWPYILHANKFKALLKN